jgi:4-amino-4-deoxy-L-arabinose transferase-like glycosyltransferase
MDAPAFEMAAVRPAAETFSASHSVRAERARSHVRRFCGPTGFVFVVSLAAILRLGNLDYASFTHTEAWRANWMRDGGWEQARRFPPAVFLLGAGIQRVVGVHEFYLRLPYAIAGIACVVFVYGLCRTLHGTERGQALGPFLAAGLAAANPILVYYSRRQMEYGFEACMVPALLWAGLSAYRRPTNRTLLVFVLTALLGLSLTFTSSFIIVAWLPALGFACLRRRPFWDRQRPGRPFALASLVFLGTTGVCWFAWLAGFGEREWIIRYFQTVEPVWPLESTLDGSAEWCVSACYGALCYVLGVSDTWPPLNWFIATLMLFVLGAGIGPLWRGNRALCVVLVVVLAEVLLAGALRLWPFGNIRHSTFLIPIVLVIAGLGLSRLVLQLGRSLPSMFLIASLLVLPTVRAAKVTLWTPTADEHIRPVFDYIRAHREPGDAMFVYYFARDAFEFYWQDAGMPVLVEPDSDRGNVHAFAGHFDRFIAQHPRVWFVFSHNWQNEYEQWLRYLRENYVIPDRLEFKDASVHLVTPPTGA